MYAKSTRPSAKRDDQIARPRRAQTCERSELRAKRAMRMCPRSGQIFSYCFLPNLKKLCDSNKSQIIFSDKRSSTTSPFPFLKNELLNG